MSLFTWFSGIFSHKQQYFYARVNSDGVCISVWRFDVPVEHADLVAIDSFDQHKIEKMWTGEHWIDPCLQHQPTKVNTFVNPEVKGVSTLFLNYCIHK